MMPITRVQLCMCVCLFVSNWVNHGPIVVHASQRSNQSTHRDWGDIYKPEHQKNHNECKTYQRAETSASSVLLDQSFRSTQWGNDEAKHKCIDKSASNHTFIQRNAPVMSGATQVPKMSWDRFPRLGGTSAISSVGNTAAAHSCFHLVYRNQAFVDRRLSR